MGGGGSPFGKPASKPSPFEADKARKGREDLSAGQTTGETPVSSNSPMSVSSQPMPGAFGTRPAGMGPQTIAGIQTAGMPFDNGSALAVAPKMESPSAEFATHNATLDVDAIREAVLQAMEAGGSQMLVHALEEGEWSGEGSQVSIQVGMSQSMIELSYTREQEKLSCQAATQVAGRAVKVRLVGGATISAEVKPRRAGTAQNAAQNVNQATGGESIKTRAAGEPVVQRMMEKFGAEIRIVMDRSER